MRTITTAVFRDADDDDHGDHKATDPLLFSPGIFDVPKTHKEPIKDFSAILYTATGAHSIMKPTLRDLCKAPTRLMAHSKISFSNITRRHSK